MRRPRRAGNFVTAVSRSTRPNPLSSNQQAFASWLAADTGLDPHVIAAWIIAEEPAGGATPVGHSDRRGPKDAAIVAAVR